MDSNYIGEVRDRSSKKIIELVDRLKAAEEIVGDAGTVFATGSYGRLEAGPESDIDVFIVVCSLKKGEDQDVRPALDEVKQILVKSELIRAVKEVGIADFDAGGKFLTTHLFDEILNEAGSPSDDFKNTFTGRMLLILESRPLIGHDLYRKLRREAIEVYFRDLDGNESNFVPYFLTNDMLRMWRTFCVNYEHFRGNTSDWRVKNLKLKYTRILTVYSAILFMAAKYFCNGTVIAEDIEEMSDLTPIERIERLSSPTGDLADICEVDGVADLASAIVSDYGEFLEFVQEKKIAIKALKADEASWRERSYHFGDNISQLLKNLSGPDEMQNRLYRCLIV